MALVRERECWTEGEQTEQDRTAGIMKEVDRLKKGIRVRKPSSDLGLYMFRSLTPHVKWVGPALLSQFAFFFSVRPSIFSRAKCVFPLRIRG